jgi:serine/threonine protein kinase
MRVIGRVRHPIHAVTSGSAMTGYSLNVEGHQITVSEKIPDGGYGVIYRATDRSGRTYALKVLQAPDEEHYCTTLKEYEIHKFCSYNSNVVEVDGISANSGTHQAMILMEF